MPATGGTETVRKPLWDYFYQSVVWLHKLNSCNRNKRCNKLKSFLTILALPRTSELSLTGMLKNAVNALS